MTDSHDMNKVYDMMLSLPGMNEEIKIGLKISRKNVLFLIKIIERSLNNGSGNDQCISGLEMINAASRQEIAALLVEMLDKAALTEMHKKLQSF